MGWLPYMGWPLLPAGQGVSSEVTGVQADVRQVVICGFGELGQSIANMLENPLSVSLERGKVPYVAFDLQVGLLQMLTHLWTCRRCCSCAGQHLRCTVLLLALQMRLLQTARPAILLQTCRGGGSWSRLTAALHPV